MARPRVVEHRIEDLGRHACIAGRAAEELATWTLVRRREKRRVTFAPRFSVNRFGAAREAVLGGLGIAILPEVLCVDDIKTRRLVRVLPSWEGEPGGVNIVYRANRSRTAAVRTCIEHLLAALPAFDPQRT